MTETSDRSLLLLLPKSVRELPADLVAVVVLVLVTCLVVLAPVVNETPLRIVFGLPFLLFLPGYALVAALFPEEGSSPHALQDDPTAETGGDGTETADEGSLADAEDDAASTGNFLAGTAENRGIDGIERVALSFGLSIAVVPLVGLLLNFTPWGIRLQPILVSISAVTLGLVAVAATRRRALPAEERFSVPYRRWIEAGRREVFEPDTRLDGALNVLLAVSILLAIGSVGYAVMFPPQGEAYTEFYILGEDEEGELVAANYPTEFELGESQPIVVGVGNQEHETIEYTVVVQLQVVEIQGNETTVIERDEIDRFTTPAIADNETWHYDHDIQPTMSGDDLRVQYLLYRGEPPAEPTLENSYRDVHLWIDVEGIE